MARQDCKRFPIDFGGAVVRPAGCAHELATISRRPDCVDAGVIGGSARAGFAASADVSGNDWGGR